MIQTHHVGDKRKKQKQDLKKYIVVIDYARFDKMQLYGAGAIKFDRADILTPLEKKFPYVGKLRSKQKKQVVSEFPTKIRQIEEYLDLVASTDLNKVLDSMEDYIRSSSKVIVDPVAYGRFKERFPEISVDKEDKNSLLRTGMRSTRVLLNIVDAFIRWTRNIAGRARYIFVRIKHGMRRIKIK